MHLKREAADAKRTVEGPLARMRFVREDRLWINNDLRRDASNILNDIMSSFEEGDYDYVVGRVEMAKLFLDMLDNFDAWLKETISKEYSICPICGQPLAKEHSCPEEWQEIIASRAGNSPAFEVKVTENEAGCPILCLTAQRVDEDRFKLRMVINYYPWHEAITTTSWLGVTQEEHELLDQIRILKDLERVTFCKGSDPQNKDQLKMADGNRILVCHRGYEHLICAGTEYLCDEDKQIGTSDGVPVIIVVPVCLATWLDELRSKLVQLREKQRTERVKPLIENLQEKFLGVV